MKKIYLRPAIKVIQMSPLEMIAMSGNFKETKTEEGDIYLDDDKAIDGNCAW